MENDMDTHSILIDAIQNRRVLTLVYDRITRTVEPHAYGKSTAGKDILLCWQVSGDHRSGKAHNWDFFVVDRISQVSEEGTCFAGPRASFSRNVKAMSTTYASL
jgi:hypothetical protein